MENSKTQPKPSDDVQLTIETVIPETENKEVQSETEKTDDTDQTEAIQTEQNHDTKDNNPQPGAPDVETVSP